MSKAEENADLAALAEIDRLVHEPARLAVMALLYVVDSADFIFLMNQTGLTWATYRRTWRTGRVWLYRG